MTDETTDMAPKRRRSPQAERLALLEAFARGPVRDLIRAVRSGDQAEAAKRADATQEALLEVFLGSYAGAEL